MLIHDRLSGWSTKTPESSSILASSTWIWTNCDSVHSLRFQNKELFRIYPGVTLWKLKWKHISCRHDHHHKFLLWNEQNIYLQCSMMSCNCIKGAMSVACYSRAILFVVECTLKEKTCSHRFFFFFNLFKPSFIPISLFHFLLWLASPFSYLHHVIDENINVKKKLLSTLLITFKVDAELTPLKRQFAQVTHFVWKQLTN